MQQDREDKLSHREFSEGRTGAKNENCLYTYYGATIGIADGRTGQTKYNDSPEALANSMFNQWKWSAGHDKNLLYGGLTAQGIGVYINSVTGKAWATWRGFDKSYPPVDAVHDVRSVEQQYGVTALNKGVPGSGAYTGAIDTSKNGDAPKLSTLPKVNRTPGLGN